MLGDFDMVPICANDPPPSGFFVSGAVHGKVPQPEDCSSLTDFSESTFGEFDASPNAQGSLGRKLRSELEPPDPSASEGHRSPPLEPAGGSINLIPELSFLARIIRRIDVGDRERPVAINLDNRIACRPREVIHSGRRNAEAAGS